MNAALSPEVADRTPVYLHCRRCGHQWIAAWLPLPVGDFAALLEASHCPRCGKGDRVYMGFAPIDPAEMPPEGKESSRA